MNYYYFHTTKGQFHVKSLSVSSAKEIVLFKHNIKKEDIIFYIGFNEYGIKIDAVNKITCNLDITIFTFISEYLLNDSKRKNLIKNWEDLVIDLEPIQ